MESHKDIRWVQRFDSYQRALNRILIVINSDTDVEQLSELEKEGLVQRFEYTFELAWKVLKDLLKEKGYIDINGPNPVLQKSLEDGWISDHDGWRKMNKARNITSHTYNDGEAEKIVNDICHIYAPLFEELANTLNKELQSLDHNN